MRAGTIRLSGPQQLCGRGLVHPEHRGVVDVDHRAAKVHGRHQIDQVLPRQHPVPRRHRRETPRHRRRRHPLRTQLRTPHLHMPAPHQQRVQLVRRAPPRPRRQIAVIGAAGVRGTPRRQPRRGHLRHPHSPGPHLDRGHRVGGDASGVHRRREELSAHTRHHAPPHGANRGRTAGSVPGCSCPGRSVPSAVR